jgi:hypothetical protein
LGDAIAFFSQNRRGIALQCPHSPHRTFPITAEICNTARAIAFHCGLVANMGVWGCDRVPPGGRAMQCPYGIHRCDRQCLCCNMGDRGSLRIGGNHGVDWGDRVPPGGRALQCNAPTRYLGCFLVAGDRVIRLMGKHLQRYDSPSLPAAQQPISVGYRNAEQRAIKREAPPLQLAWGAPLAQRI